MTYYFSVIDSRTFPGEVFIALAKREPFTSLNPDPMTEPGNLWFEFGPTPAEACEKLLLSLPNSGGVVDPPPFFLAWYDFYVGFYYDRHNKILYFAPFPMCVFVLWRGIPSGPSKS